jgi:hypothetical protein
MTKYTNYSGLEAHIKITDLLQKLRDEVIIPLRAHCIDVREKLVEEKARIIEEIEKGNKYE